MIAVYLAAVVIVLASLLAGRALLALLGRDDWTWLEGAIGLAALITIAHIAISLSNGATIPLLILILILLGAATYLWRRRDASHNGERRRDAQPTVQRRRDVPLRRFAAAGRRSAPSRA